MLAISSLSPFYIFYSSTTPSNSFHSLSFSLTLSIQLSLLSLCTFFGPSFQSTFNWLGVACRWDDRSSPPGEVDMYRYGAPTHCHRINIGWLQGIRCKGLFKEGFLPDIYLSPAPEMRPYTQCLKYPKDLAVGNSVLLRIQSSDLSIILKSAMFMQFICPTSLQYYINVCLQVSIIYLKKWLNLFHLSKLWHLALGSHCSTPVNSIKICEFNLFLMFKTKPTW